jgi:hypothetical protein
MKFGQLIDMIHAYDSLLFLKARAETSTEIYGDAKVFSKEKKEEIKILIKEMEKLREIEIGDVNE